MASTLKSCKSCCGEGEDMGSVNVELVCQQWGWSLQREGATHVSRR
jgi:hypothetical protein